MKKLSLLIGAMMVAAGASAAAPSWVKFSSVGPDKYADGTPVEEGEVYALVWVATGSSFKGINAKTGELVDSENNKIVAAASLATAKHNCPNVVFPLRGENAKLIDTGTFSVYLFDTRVTKTVVDATTGQTTTTTTVGVGKDFDFTATKDFAINGYAPASATITNGDTAVAQDAVAMTEASVLPNEDLPDPVVQAIEIKNGQVHVTVNNTLPYLRYTISAGASPKDLSKGNVKVTGLTGMKKPADSMTLIVDKPEENRFFKVIRN